MSLLALATRGRKSVDAGFDQVASGETAPYGSTYAPNGYVPIENLRHYTGYGISPETAYNIITIYQCVRVLAETFASLPLMVYRKLPNGGKERAEDHELYDVLHRAPNPQMTSFVWRELLMGHLATWGNAFNEKTRDASGRLNLWPIRPDRVQPFYYSPQLARESRFGASAGQKGYWYLDPIAGRKELDPASIFHVQGLSSSGLLGLSPITVMRNTIRLYSSAERFGTTFFDNDARPGTILSHPKTLSPAAIERLRNQMESMKGAANAGRTIVLEEGLTVSEVGIHPEDAQFMETRLFQKRELAGAYRIQPHKIGDLERATFSNIEQQSIEFIQDTMVPWFVRFEQQGDADLLSPTDRDTYFIEFLVDGYLRGDAKTRAEALAIRWQHGTVNADEWRSYENENAIPDGLGKMYFTPVNYAPVNPAEGYAAQAPATVRETVTEQGPNAPGGPGRPVATPPAPPALSVVKSLGRFDCPTCGKLLNRLAGEGTVSYCRHCGEERTMALATS